VCVESNKIHGFWGFFYKGVASKATRMQRVKTTKAKPRGNKEHQHKTIS
jgi:hypothetical protein